MAAMLRLNNSFIILFVFLLSSNALEVSFAGSFTSLIADNFAWEKSFFPHHLPSCSHQYNCMLDEAKQVDFLGFPVLINGRKLFDASPVDVRPRIFHESRIDKVPRKRVGKYARRTVRFLRLYYCDGKQIRRKGAQILHHTPRLAGKMPSHKSLSPSHSRWKEQTTRFGTLKSYLIDKDETNLSIYDMQVEISRNTGSEILFLPRLAFMASSAMQRLKKGETYGPHTSLCAQPEKKTRYKAGIFIGRNFWHFLHDGNSKQSRMRSTLKFVSPFEDIDEAKEKPLPTIALLGRPNVGKSTIFNLLCSSNNEEDKAIVHDSPGVTRDSIFATTNYLGLQFNILDTSGLLPEISEEDIITRHAYLQGLEACKKADCLLFIVDGQAGVHPHDEDIAAYLRRLRKPVCLCVNKSESPKEGELQAVEFFRLGLGRPYPCSGIHGSGILDALKRPENSLFWKRRKTFVGAEYLKALKNCFELIGYSSTSSTPHAKQQDDSEVASSSIRVSLIGRPNVGKSSFMNKLVGYERCIVSTTPGTTRDNISVSLQHEGSPTFVFTDTSGVIRERKIRKSHGLDRMMFDRTRRAIFSSDVCVLMIDSMEGVTDLDLVTSRQIKEAGRACVIICNKWDLGEKNESTLHKTEEAVRLLLPEVCYAEILFVSSKTGLRVNKVYTAVANAAGEHRKRVNTSALNKTLEDIMGIHPPQSFEHRSAKIYYATQVNVSPPSFAIFCNDESLFSDALRRFIEDGLRRAFGFKGTPIRIFWRSKKDQNSGSSRRGALRARFVSS